MEYINRRLIEGKNADDVVANWADTPGLMDMAQVKADLHSIMWENVRKRR